MNRRKAAQWLVLVGVLAIAMSATWFVPRGYHYWQVERAIARFERQPSQLAATRLGGLLRKGIPSQKQGERILGMVLSPAVTTRRTYPAESIPTISIESPFRLNAADNRDAFANLQSCLSFEGDERPCKDKMEANITGYLPYILRCGNQPISAGTYDWRIRIDCTLTVYHVDRSWWRRLKNELRGRYVNAGLFREAASYNCRFEFPVQIVVAEREDAEQIGLVSNPELDEAMRRSFACRRSQGDVLDVGPDGMPSGRGETICLEWTNLPVAVAFEPVLRLSDGREIHSRPCRLPRIRTRSGKSGVWATSATDFAVTAPGDYEGTCVLRPDPNFAYDDPAIKEIWNGTLEFPMSFSLYEEMPVR